MESYAGYKGELDASTSDLHFQYMNQFEVSSSTIHFRRKLNAVFSHVTYLVSVLGDGSIYSCPKNAVIQGNVYVMAYGT